MEYFFYCRDRPGTWPLRVEFNDDHWAFMDRYDEVLIARGPTLNPDETTTGSMHVADLPDAEAARVFAFEEPNYRRGIYDEVLVRRWSGLTDRTMWDFTGAVAEYERFLLLGHGKPGTATVDPTLDAEQRAYLLEGDYRDRLIVGGSLLSEDGTDWTGTALTIELPDRAAAEAVLPNSPFGKAGMYENVEVLPWRFGGRTDDD
ncbi:YciI family protein [Actinomadura hibisca]|uniref:YciI family protein n=1 Tax=Actinomadura hibisca TaxID=68565 RepID=UPI00082F83B4|nr:YciI family protein [Actinomadura hibisca]